MNEGLAEYTFKEAAYTRPPIIIPGHIYRPVPAGGFDRPTLADILTICANRPRQAQGDRKKFHTPDRHRWRLCCLLKELAEGQSQRAHTSKPGMEEFEMIAHPITNRPACKRVFGYGRGSTDKQTLTLDAQEACCRQWFDLQVKAGRLAPDTEWGEFFGDFAQSGKVSWNQRLMGVQLFTRLAPGDIIVVAKYDRAIRSTIDCCNVIQLLNSMQVGLHILDTPAIDTTTSNGILVAQILAAVKEHELREVSERTKAVLSRVEVMGKRPVGWKAKGKKLVPDEKARQMTKVCYDMLLDGQTFTKIALANDRHKFATTDGKPWSIWKIKRHVRAYQNGWPKKAPPRRAKK